MAVMAGSLYRALVSANVPDDQAQKAAEEVAGYDEKISRITADMTLLKWMVGFNLALTVALVSRIFLAGHP